MARIFAHHSMADEFVPLNDKLPWKPYHTAGHPTGPPKDYVDAIVYTIGPRSSTGGTLLKFNDIADADARRLHLFMLEAYYMMRGSSPFLELPPRIMTAYKRAMDPKSSKKKKSADDDDDDDDDDGDFEKAQDEPCVRHDTAPIVRHDETLVDADGKFVGMRVWYYTMTKKITVSQLFGFIMQRNNANWTKTIRKTLRENAEYMRVIEMTSRYNDVRTTTDYISEILTPYLMRMRSQTNLGELVGSIRSMDGFEDSHSLLSPEIIFSPIRTLAESVPNCCAEQMCMKNYTNAHNQVVRYPLAHQVLAMTPLLMTPYHCLCMPLLHDIRVQAQLVYLRELQIVSGKLAMRPEELPVEVLVRARGVAVEVEQTYAHAVSKGAAPMDSRYMRHETRFAPYQSLVDEANRVITADDVRRRAGLVTNSDMVAMFGDELSELDSQDMELADELDRAQRETNPTMDDMFATEDARRPTPGAANNASTERRIVPIGGFGANFSEDSLDGFDVASSDALVVHRGGAPKIRIETHLDAFRAISDIAVLALKIASEKKCLSETFTHGSDAHRDALATFRLDSVFEFWRVFTSTNKLESSTLSMRNWYAEKSPKERWCNPALHWLRARNLTPYGNMVVNTSDAIQTNFRIMHGKMHLIKQVFAVAHAAFRVFFGLKPNMLIQGAADASKSFALECVEAWLGRGMYARIGTASNHAFGTDDHVTGVVIFMHEAIIEWFGLDRNGREIPDNAEFKDRVAAGFTENHRAVVNQETGKVESVVTFSLHSNSTIVLTNHKLPTNNAARSRMIFVSASTVDGLDDQYPPYSNPSGLKPEDQQRMEAMNTSDQQLLMFYVVVVEQAISAKVLEDVDMTVFGVVTSRINLFLRSQYHVSLKGHRNIDQIMQMARAEVIRYAVWVELFTEVGRGWREDANGVKHFSPAALLEIQKRLVCTMEIAVRIITLFKFVWVSDIHTSIIRGIASIMDYDAKRGARQYAAYLRGLEPSDKAEVNRFRDGITGADDPAAFLDRPTVVDGVRFGPAPQGGAADADPMDSYERPGQDNARVRHTRGKNVPRQNDDGMPMFTRYYATQPGCSGRLRRGTSYSETGHAMSMQGTDVHANRGGGFGSLAGLGRSGSGHGNAMQDEMSMERAINAIVAEHDFRYFNFNGNVYQLAHAIVDALKRDLGDLSVPSITAIVCTLREMNDTRIDVFDRTAVGCNDASSLSNVQLMMLRTEYANVHRGEALKITKTDGINIAVDLLSRDLSGAMEDAIQNLAHAHTEERTMVVELPVRFPPTPHLGIDMDGESTTHIPGVITLAPDPNARMHTFDVFARTKLHHGQYFAEDHARAHIDGAAKTRSIGYAGDDSDDGYTSDTNEAGGLFDDSATKVVERDIDLVAFDHYHESVLLAPRTGPGSIEYPGKYQPKDDRARIDQCYRQHVPEHVRARVADDLFPDAWVAADAERVITFRLQNRRMVREFRRNAAERMLRAKKRPRHIDGSLLIMARNEKRRKLAAKKAAERRLSKIT